MMKPARANSNDEGLVLHQLKRKERVLARKAARKERASDEKAEAAVCRICLGEEDAAADPLISPCKCSGTMSHIHLECLREWLNSKLTTKEGPRCKTYCWKVLECELCKERFPSQIHPNAQPTDPTLKSMPKLKRKQGDPLQVL